MAYCFRSFDINVNQFFACSNYHKHAYLYTHSHTNKKDVNLDKHLFVFFIVAK